MLPASTLCSSQPSTPLLNNLLSLSYRPSPQHPSVYLFCGSLVISASRVMSRLTRLSKLPLRFLTFSDHSFSYLIYAHFPDNWFSGNSNDAGNLLEPPFTLSSPLSFPDHQATSLPVLKKKPYAVFESHIHYSPLSIYSSIYSLPNVSSPMQNESLYPILSSTARVLYLPTENTIFFFLP